MAKSKFSDITVDRRTMLQGVGGLGVAAGSSLALNIPSARASRIDADALKGPYIDLTTAAGNVNAMARVQGSLNVGETKYGWFSGNVMGVRDNEPLRDLFKFEGFSCAKLIELEDGGYQKVLREVGFYIDHETGEILEEYDNPYTGEKVRVVPIANDPFNGKIQEYFPPPPSFGGLNESAEMPKIPYILPWMIRGNMAQLERHIHLYYPSALKPEEWPRENHGPMTRVTEIYMYQIPYDDLQNEDIASVEYHGTWSRVTPWLPWMLMDNAPGHCYYECYMGAVNSLDDINPKMVDYASKYYPKYLEAPAEFEEPSLSSLENYSREQQPEEPKGPDAS